MKHEKLQIVKQLLNLWRAGCPWEDRKCKYKLERNEITVDFTCGNYIIFTEIELEIKGIAYPNKDTKKFNVGDTRMINAIENFITANIEEY